jgi:Flp pilus assembly protein TadD
MERMKNIPIIPVIVALLVFAGCRKPQPVVPTAQQLCNDASSAMQEDDHARAASLLRQAIGIKPEFAEAWVSLGMTLVRMNQNEEARSTYERALELHVQRYTNTHSPNELQQQAFVLLLLDRYPEAEALLANGKHAHPGDASLQTFADNLPELAKSDAKKWQIPKQ